MNAVLVRPSGERISGYVTDLSSGGAGIETVQPVPADLERFTLLVTEENFELRVECEARAVRELWRKRVIHAQFLGAQHREPVDEVIRQVQENAANITPFPSAKPVSLVRRLFRRRAA